MDRGDQYVLFIARERLLQLSEPLLLTGRTGGDNVLSTQVDNLLKSNGEEIGGVGMKLFNSIGKSLSSHDYVFWCGDFNYRIDLDIDVVKQLVAEENWEMLLNYDQLTVQKKEDHAFSKYLEGPINFAPTYKYDINSDDYDTSEKSRIPAWTDRVLFRKRHPTTAEEKESGELNYGEILFYGRAELKTSDHRPVLGEFKIDILKVDTEKRNQVFRSVIEKIGPLDATVIIQEQSELSGLGETSIFDEAYVQEILGKLNNEIGEIVLARFGEDNMRVTFKDGGLAMKIANIGYIDVMEKRFKVTLKTPTWTDLVEEEVQYGVSNTVSLLEGVKQLDIDDLNEYDLSKVSRPSSPTDSEGSLSIGNSVAPARPPPPAASKTTNGETVSAAKAVQVDFFSFSFI